MKLRDLNDGDAFTLGDRDDATYTVREVRDLCYAIRKDYDATLGFPLDWECELVAKELYSWNEVDVGQYVRHRRASKWVYLKLPEGKRYSFDKGRVVSDPIGASTPMYELVEPVYFKYEFITNTVEARLDQCNPGDEVRWDERNLVVKSIGTQVVLFEESPLALPLDLVVEREAPEPFDPDEHVCLVDSDGDLLISAGCTWFLRHQPTALKLPSARSWSKIKPATITDYRFMEVEDA